VKKKICNLLEGREIFFLLNNEENFLCIYLTESGSPKYNVPICYSLKKIKKKERKPQVAQNLQASLSLPGSPFNIRRGSRGSHQFTLRNGRRFGDRKPLVLSTYLDAQEHLPYADDSNAVTPMSEENGAIIVPVYTTLGSRHSSYTSHASRISYTSHGDLLNGKAMTKESRLRCRSRNPSSYVPEVIMDNSKHMRDFVSNNKIS
jgi:hypothetical protein